MLNLQAGDELHDLFEGSGAVTRAFRQWLTGREALRVDQITAPGRTLADRS